MTSGYGTNQEEPHVDQCATPVDKYRSRSSQEPSHGTYKGRGHSGGEIISFKRDKRVDLAANTSETIDAKIPPEPTERTIDLALTKPGELSPDKALELQFIGLPHNKPIRKLVVVNGDFLTGNIL